MPGTDLPPATLPSAHLSAEGVLRMGLSPLAEADWLELDDRYLAQLREKRRLLAERRDQVFQALPEAEAASAETLEAVANWLLAWHPGRFRRDAVHFENRLLGEIVRIEPAEDHPLLVAGLNVVEDLCLMQRPEPGAPYRLVAASLSFPSHWRLAEKLGRPMAEIHGPVPGLNAAIGRGIDRFLSALKPGRLATRANWSVMPDARLFQPGDADERWPETPEALRASAVLRVERQAFRKLPRSGAIVFTIGIHQKPWTEVAGDPALGAVMARLLAGLDPTVAAYKGLTTMGTWLRSGETALSDTSRES